MLSKWPSFIITRDKVKEEIPIYDLEGMMMYSHFDPFFVIVEDSENCIRLAEYVLAELPNYSVYELIAVNKINAESHAPKYCIVKSKFKRPYRGMDGVLICHNKSEFAKDPFNQECIQYDELCKNTNLKFTFGDFIEKSTPYCEI